MEPDVVKTAGSNGTKTAEVEDDLRRQIFAGDYQPGARLPTRRALQSSYGVSVITIERALRNLIDGGFVYTRGTAGTFVTENPPHLCKYFLVLPAHPGRPGWSRLHQALQNECNQIFTSDPRSIHAFLGIDDAHGGDDSALIREVVARRVAGLIFANHPFSLSGSPLMDTPDVPKISIMADSPFPGVPAVYPDWQSFADRALMLLRERGRRNVALIQSCVEPTRQMVSGQVAAAFIRHHGRDRFTIPPHWIQSVHPSAPAACEGLADLLVRGTPDGTPDALIVTDDNLVEYAVAGVMSAGVRLGDDLDLIAHCNMPWPTPAVAGVTRLGFDIHHLLEVCVDCLERQRTGKRVERTIFIPAVFEHEIQLQ